MAMKKYSDFVSQYVSWISRELPRAKEIILDPKNKQVKEYGNVEIANQVLDIVTEYKDLGVILDNKLTCHSHVKRVESKCHKIIGFFLWKLNHFKGEKTSIYLFYASTIMSVLKLCIVVYSTKV